MSEPLNYASPMPNPSNPNRGPCQTCRSYGGVHDARYGDTICLSPKDSGKSVCRMPEIGCAAWTPKKDEPPRTTLRK